MARLHPGFNATDPPDQVGKAATNPDTNLDPEPDSVSTNTPPDHAFCDTHNASPPLRPVADPALISPTPKTPVRPQPWLAHGHDHHHMTDSSGSIAHSLHRLSLAEHTDLPTAASSGKVHSCGDSDPGPPQPSLALTQLRSARSPSPNPGDSYSPPLADKSPLIVFQPTPHLAGPFSDSVPALEPVLELESPPTDAPISPSPLTSPFNLRDLLPSRSPPAASFRRGPSSPSSFQLRFQSCSTPPPSSATHPRRSPILSPTPSRLRIRTPPPPPPPSRSNSSPLPGEASPLNSRFNEPFTIRRSISLHSSSASPGAHSYAPSPFLRTYSVPSTPTSARSRSPSISSLETIPDTPDAEAEALKKEQEDDMLLRERRADSFSSMSSRNTDFRDRYRRRGRRGTGDVDGYSRFRKSSWDVSPGGLGGTRDKRKRWSVCGGERRADLDLETIWED